MQLSLGDNSQFKFYAPEERAEILLKIEKGVADLDLLRNIRDDWRSHLSKPHGVPDNYVGYHPDVIDAVKRKYPKLIEDIDNDTFVRHRLQNVFAVIVKTLESGNINPLILKMYLEYLKPSADEGERYRDIVFKLGEALGSVTEPEKKE